MFGNLFKRSKVNIVIESIIKDTPKTHAEIVIKEVMDDIDKYEQEMIDNGEMTGPLSRAFKEKLLCGVRCTVAYLDKNGRLV